MSDTRTIEDVGTPFWTRRILMRGSWIVAALTMPLMVCSSVSATAEPGGAGIYADACASCHGPDGRGAPEGTAITVPLPDFTDCKFVTREGDGNWHELVAHGGKGLGLSSQMPAFGDALTSEQIQATLDYIRTFCHDARWPNGALNFPRALVTGKAFPEDEALLVGAFTQGRGQQQDWNMGLSVAHRVGARGQVELEVPLAIHDVPGGATTGGIGDLTVGYKQVFYTQTKRRDIGAVSLDVGLPTGDHDRHLGTGTVTFSPALLVGNAATRLVLQGEVRAQIPVHAASSNESESEMTASEDESRAERIFLCRLAVSYPLSTLRRAFVPTIEAEGQINATERESHFSLTPQVYKGITQRGNVALALGVQIPVDRTSNRFDYRVLGFLLWDYGDGGLWW